MTYEKALAILQISSAASAAEARKSYHDLMRLYHPDAGLHNGETAKQLNRAYEVFLQEYSLHETAGNHDWDSEIDEDIFCERNIYEEHVFDDGLSHKIKMSRGKYLWNPEAEDFSMLLFSVHEACSDILKQAGTQYGSSSGKDHPDGSAHMVRLFHLLVQQFTDPLYALEHLESPYRFRCYVHSGNELSPGETYYTVIRSNNICISNGMTILGQVSFREKYPYYIMAPLLQAGAASGWAQIRPVSDRTKNVPCELFLSLTGTQFSRDMKKANEAIRSRL